MNDGILQRFVVPKEAKNSVIRCVWTPHFCLFERRTNRLPLNDLRFDYYERACTYEGKDYYSDCGNWFSLNTRCRTAKRQPASP